MSWPPQARCQNLHVFIWYTTPHWPGPADRHSGLSYDATATLALATLAVSVAQSAAMITFQSIDEAAGGPPASSGPWRLPLGEECWKRGGGSAQARSCEAMMFIRLKPKVRSCGPKWFNLAWRMDKVDHDKIYT